MDKFLDLIKKRHSCHCFNGNKIPSQKIVECVEAARLAPSSCNSQPWHFFIVTEPDRLSRVAKYLQDGNSNSFIHKASAFVIVTEDIKIPFSKFENPLKNQRFRAIDIGIVTSYFILAATELNISTCILGSFNERKLKILLSIPKDKRVRLAIAMGYEDDNNNQSNKVRKPIEEIMEIENIKFATKHEK